MGVGGNLGDSGQGVGVAAGGGLGCAEVARRGGEGQAGELVGGGEWGGHGMRGPPPARLIRVDRDSGR